MKWIPKMVSFVSLWGVVGAIILFVEPEILKDIIVPGLYMPFLLMLMLAIWYSVALLVKSFWMSLVVSITLLSGVVLSMLKIMHIGLAIVLLLTLVMESWYIYHRYEKTKSVDEQKN